MKRINAIYARQSVDRADSISIESQIEFCKYELKGGSFKEYKDKGYSGKNTVRPQLQQLLTDIRRGEVEKVIVYKLDRPFYSGFFQYDESVSAVSGGICLFYREI